MADRGDNGESPGMAFGEQAVKMFDPSKSGAAWAPSDLEFERNESA